MLDEGAFDPYASEADEITTNCAHLKNAVKMSLPKDMKKALVKNDGVGICKVSAFLMYSRSYETFLRHAARQRLQNAPTLAMYPDALTICGCAFSAARQAVAATRWDMPRLTISPLTSLKEYFFAGSS